MLILTGQFNGKTYKDEIVSLEELARYFNLPPVPQGNLMLELKILDKKVRINKADGTEVIRRSHLFPAAFNATSEKGDSFHLRYTTAPARIGAHGEKKYTPDFCQYAGKIMGFTSKDYDKYIFFALNPQCATSPFAGRDPYYKVYDPKAEAFAAASKAQEEVAMLTEIWSGTSDAKIRIKGAGLVVKGQALPVNKNTHVPTIRKMLADLYHRHPKDFVEAWRSENTLLFGLLMDAIDSSVIEYKQNANPGRAGWVWNKGEWAGQVYCFVPSDQERLRTLRQWSALPQNYNDVMEYLTRNLDPETTAAVSDDMTGVSRANAVRVQQPQQQPQASSIEALATRAVQEGVIGFVHAEGAARWLNDDGVPEGNPIVEGVTAKTWFAAAIPKLKAPPLLKQLKARLDGAPVPEGQNA